MCTEADCSFSPSDAQAPDGSQLIRRARSGCRDALNVLFQECCGRLRAQVERRMNSLLRAHLESNDIVQVTLLHAFQSMGQFRGNTRECFVGWLTGIARNAIRDEMNYLRRQRRDICRTVPLGGEDQTHTVLDGHAIAVARLVSGERTRRLEQALASLSRFRREVLLLRLAGGLTFRDIGLRVRKSPDACRMIFARAKETLACRVRVSDRLIGPADMSRLLSRQRVAAESVGRSGQSADRPTVPAGEASPRAQKNVA